MAQSLNRSLPVTAPAAITSKICGGLGNQMLQYAAGRACALRLDRPLVLDLSFYGRDRHRKFELDRFPIDACWTHNSSQPILDALRRLRRKHHRRSTYQEQSKNFEPRFESITAPATLDGYFFSEQYFSSHADRIRQELRPPTPTDRCSQEVQRRIVGQESIALHIRRGDYVTNKNAKDRFWSCTLDYYHRAMERIHGGGTVFVFSDDIQWAKENLQPVKSLEFVDANPQHDGLRDLWLMTHAHHHIIANSTFSWWGAWLAGEDKGMTIAPAKWFNDASIDDGDIIPNRWIRM